MPQRSKRCGDLEVLHDVLSTLSTADSLVYREKNEAAKQLAGDSGSLINPNKIGKDLMVA